MKDLTPIISLILFFLMGGIAISPADAQSNQSPILFIYDASGSMWGKLNNETKKEAAADVLVKTIESLDSDQKIGFMAYGHRSKSDCQDVELLIDLENTSKSKVKSIVDNINPLGKTPLAYSAEVAINKIKEVNTKTTIILITDGIESCNGDLCKIIELAVQAGIEFKLHIVGFGLKPNEVDPLKCAAEAGDGNYYDAKDSDQLEKALNEALHQKIDDHAPNHSFFTVKNGQPVDAWIKIIDKNSGEEIRGVRTYQDTASVFLPNGEYDIIINPLEGSKIASKSMSISKTNDSPSHQEISFDGGIIEVFVSNNNVGRDATIKVTNPKTQQIVAAGRTYGRKKPLEVDNGIYVVEIMPLHIKGAFLTHKFENVEVKAKETTPLSFDYKTGDLSIGVQTQSGELVDASVKVTDTENTSYVTGKRTYTSTSSNPRIFNIQPGTYKVEILTLGKHKGASLSETLQVFPGQLTSKIFIIN